jgi:hypothetical protein
VGYLFCHLIKIQLDQQVLPSNQSKYPKKVLWLRLGFDENSVGSKLEKQKKK